MTVENVKTILETYSVMQKDIRRLEEVKLELLDIQEETKHISVRNLETKRQLEQVNILQNKMMQENADQVLSSQRAMQKTVELIDTVENEDFREILRCKYISGMTFDQIAEELNYCRKTVMRKHNKIVRQLAETM